MSVLTRSLAMSGIAVCLVGVNSSLAQAPTGSASTNNCTPTTCAYLNPDLSPEERAKDLVGRMTLEEKVSQTTDRAAAIPRLGVPEYGWWNEALHGVARYGEATVFPQAIGMAATWDTPLVRRIGGIIAVEGRAKYNDAVSHGRRERFAGLTFWSPNINIFRDPRWGRGQETYGEDPFLTARTGVAFVRGLQGEDPHYLALVSTPKHFAVHSGPEPLRHGFNVDVSPHDLEDTYLPAFRATITEAKADSIMCAYNAVDGKPACVSDLLLQDRLRSAWKFNGYVVSDCDAVADVNRGHHFAPDDVRAAAESIKAGTDLDCGYTYRDLVQAVHQGLLTNAELDTAVVRLFTARMRLGMFDPPERVPFSKLTIADNATPAHAEVALEAARKSIVLLSNKHNTLPLKQSSRIAVVGPTAELIQVLEGNYNGTPRTPALPLAGMRKQFGAEKVTYSAGSILADGFMSPVPSSVLKPAVDSHEHGLRAEYFDNTAFNGQPKAVRVDSLIDCDWDHISPAAGIPRLGFSVRWSGFITPPAPGHYSFSFRLTKPQRPDPRAGVSATDPTGEGSTMAGGSAAPHLLRIFLDDKQVYDFDEGKPKFDVDFPDARPHAIRLEYVRTYYDRNLTFQWIPPAQPLLDAAVQSAKQADAVVAFVGLSPDLEGEEMNVHVPGFDGGDRTDIGLPAAQQNLLKAVKATGKPLIVVLTSGSAIAANWANENADAVLEAWYSGQAGGTAIAETLAGANNPSGRLPVTFYRDLKDLPPFTDYSMRNRTYRYFNGPVLYPFGYGLSYTTFAYSNAQLGKAEVQAGAPATASVAVRNTGKMAGEEVVQLYVMAPGDEGIEHPSLAGFTRVQLTPGESKRVSIDIDPRWISRVDDKGERHIKPGEYTLWLGGGQPGKAAGTEVKLEVKGSADLPH
ncbi:MAG TPA: glycoside hydrolase family 3 C-terminal domain-containing protein [Acidobacteriaceae bacterium]|nr:glycoside hydrolase family 3 C-terminal domain-containing protein [Acidobacteriaceae bacterium]